MTRDLREKQVVKGFEMKKNVFLAGVAVAFMVAGVSGSFAQSANENGQHKFKKVQYRPLRVTPRQAPVEAAGDAVGAAVAAPFGVAGAVAGGAVTGAATLVEAPFAGLAGGTVGISGVGAPPLPIAARYARTGKVASTYDEGYAQDVPVDISGPIYKLNFNSDGIRTVTPFTLAAFPITAAASIATAPVRAIVAPHP